MDNLRIGVTGARKAAELAAALERRGASAMVGPLVTTDLPVADDVLLAESDAATAGPVEWIAASTGVGMRLWADVARRHGRYDRVHATLAGARRVARGAKAVGGLAAFSLDAHHVTDEEVDAAVVAWILQHAEPGQRVIAQLHGTDDGAHRPLVDAGLALATLQPYVAGRLPEDEQRARALVQAVADGALDLVTFTSPGAARNLYVLAAAMGDDVLAGVEASLGSDVAVAVIGPVTARVFDDRGVAIAVSPDRHRQGELVRAVDRWSASR